MSALVSPRGLASPSRSARFNRAYRGKDRRICISFFEFYIQTHLLFKTSFIMEKF